MEVQVLHAVDMQWWSPSRPSHLKALHIGLAKGLLMRLPTNGSGLGSVPLQLGLLGHHRLKEEEGGKGQDTSAQIRH